MQKSKAYMMMSAATLCLVAACTPYPTQDMDPAAPEPAKLGELDDLRVGKEPVADPSEVKIELYNPGEEDVEITEIRRGALLEAAQGYGSQMGYARRGWEIEKLLEKRSMQLSQVFDFSRVASEAPVKAGYIIPPIVSRSFDAFKTTEEGREASVADEYLTIVAPGKIMPVTPTWRDYLIFSPAAPEEPAKSLYPGNTAEKLLFEKWFHAGWKAGVELADAEMESRLDRLRRDYEGMLQYRRLVSMGMMDRLVLQDADFGVTGGGDEMRIGSRTVRIVSDAEFETNPKRWSVRSVSERDSLIVENGRIPTLIDEITK
jgi:defect-in-organelle-trafficking protein DotC